MKISTSLKVPSSASAFSLVEVTLALGICAFCLISLVGLLPAGISATNNASRETTAANIAAAVLSDLQMSIVVSEDSNGRRVQDIKTNSVLYGINGTPGTRSFNFIEQTNKVEPWSVASGNGQYRITINSTQNGTGGSYNFTVKVAWPGIASAKEQGSVTIFGRSR